MKKATRSGNRKKRQKLPRGWTQKRVRGLITHYDRQTEDEELAEYEAATAIEGESLMLVPSDLVPEIQKLIARRRGA
jgi:hypothetical protein